MRAKIAKYAKEIAIFFITMSILANILSFYRTLDLNKDKLSLSSVELLMGELYTLPKDGPIVIYFWGEWCPVCKMQSKNIETLSKYFSVLSVAVNSGNDKEINSYLKNRDLHFNTVNDSNGSIAKKFRVSIFPTTIIFDKNGDEIFSDVGYTSTFGLCLRAWLASFL